MQIDGEYSVPADVDTVWQALNDPAVLKQCIKGCETIEKISDTEFAAKVTSKIGPVKAKFDVEIGLSNLDPPHKYTLSGGGKGGVVGFAKGVADVQLAPLEDGQTQINYQAGLQASGKLAQIGSRLFVSATRKLAADFFDTFGQYLAGELEPG